MIISTCINFITNFIFGICILFRGIPHFYCPFISQWLYSCFHLATVNRATMTVEAGVSNVGYWGLWEYASSSIAESNGKSASSFLRPFNTDFHSGGTSLYFYWWWISLPLSPPHICCHLFFVWWLYLTHSYWDRRKSQSSFNLPFPDGKNVLFCFVLLSRLVCLLLLFYIFSFHWK